MFFTSPRGRMPMHLHTRAFWKARSPLQNIGVCEKHILCGEPLSICWYIIGGYHYHWNRWTKWIHVSQYSRQAFHDINTILVQLISPQITGRKASWKKVEGCTCTVSKWQESLLMLGPSTTPQINRTASVQQPASFDEDLEGTLTLNFVQNADAIINNDKATW